MQFRAEECEHSCLIALLNIIKDYSIEKAVELALSLVSFERVFSLSILFKCEAVISAVLLDSALVDLLSVVVN